MFKILNVDHIGIAVPNLDDVEKVFQDVLGIKNNGEETVKDQKVTTAFYPVGEETELEFLESTSPDGPIAKFIEKNNGRGGIQHVALRVDDIEAAIKDIKAKGLRMIDNEPRKGAGGAMIAFIHPKSTNGVLVELCSRE